MTRWAHQSSIFFPLKRSLPMLFICSSSDMNFNKRLFYVFFSPVSFFFLKTNLNFRPKAKQKKLAGSFSLEERNGL